MPGAVEGYRNLLISETHHLPSNRLRSEGKSIRSQYREVAAMRKEGTRRKLRENRGGTSAPNAGPSREEPS